MTFGVFAFTFFGRPVSGGFYVDVNGTVTRHAD